MTEREEMNIKRQTEKKFEQHARNLKDLKIHAEYVLEYGAKLSSRLGEIEGLLVDVMAVDETPRITALLNRASRTLQLCRQMETGSFLLEINHAVDIAWRGLP